MIKGAVLAGGNATRLEELTKRTNKHLLPVGNYPMIYHPLKALERAGIQEVCIVTGAHHCGDIVEHIGSGLIPRREGSGNDPLFNLDITYRVQDQAGGIAQGISLLKRFSGDDKLVVILGDNIFVDDISPFVRDFEQQQGGARILLAEVDHPEHYGHPVIDRDGFIVEMVEKPPLKSIEDNWIATGLYMFDHNVFEFIPRLEPSLRGELEITELLNQYIKDSVLKYDKYPGIWFDAGESIDHYVGVSSELLGIQY